MFVHQLFEGEIKRVIVIYPGRFQPFHLGHKEVFQALQAKFGIDNVFIGTSNNQKDVSKSPFNFSDKIQLMNAAGVSNNHVIEVSSPYMPDDYIQAIGFNPAETVMIFAVGAPDLQRLEVDAHYTELTPTGRPSKIPSGKRVGDPKPFKSFKDLRDCVTADQHQYVMIVSEREKRIEVNGKEYDASHGTQVRALWNAVRNDPKASAHVLEQLYGRATPELMHIFNKIQDPNAAAPAAPKPSPTLKPVAAGGKKAPAVKPAVPTKAVTPAVSEEQEEVTPIKHRVSVTVVDADHPMVTKRKESMQKTVRVSGSDREQAINAAIAYYRRKGYKVLDHNYIGPVKENVAEGEVIHHKFGMKQDQKGKTPYYKNPDIEIPTYDPVARTFWHAARSGNNPQEPFDRFETQPAGATSAHIIGITKDGKKVKVSTASAQLADVLAKAYNRGGFTDVPLERVPLGMQESGYGRNRGYNYGFASPTAPSLGGRREREDDEGWDREEQERQATWYIRINGKIIKDKMDVPYQFRGREAAVKAARTMMAKPFNAGKQFTLSTSPTDREQGVNEFAPPGSNDGGDDGFSEETLKRLAAEWYNGDEDPRVERTLMAAGWEIGQDEGYDDEPGVFVVQAGDVNGNSYMSWPAHELKQGVAEGKLDEKWSQKYKRSINCSHPRGFSQRAHCAGRKKNEAAELTMVCPDCGWSKEGLAEGAKVDRMVKHITKTYTKKGKSKDDAESIAWATANKRGMLDNKNKKISENAEQLNIGDPVIITGKGIQFYGKTGDVESFGDNKRFVIVNLYNHGKHSFHSSDVSYNDYTDRDDLDEDMYQYDAQDPYNSEFAPRAGMGRMTLRGWKKSLARRVAELAQEMSRSAEDGVIDKAALWDQVYKKMQSMNLDPIAQEIELAHQELENIRRRGGIRSRAFKNAQ